MMRRLLARLFRLVRRHRPPSLDAGIPPRPEVATAGVRARAGHLPPPAMTALPTLPPRVFHVSITAPDGYAYCGPATLPQLAAARRHGDRIRILRLVRVGVEA